MCPTLRDPMNGSTPGFHALHYHPKFAQTHNIHWVGDAIQPAHPLSPLLFMPSNFPSIMIFSSESALRIRWPKFWSFNFSISPSNVYSFRISFRIDWFPCSPRDPQESSPTPQFKSFNSSALSFMVQLSHPYMTTGKTIALTRWTFVGKVKWRPINFSFPTELLFKGKKKHFLLV